MILTVTLNPCLHRYVAFRDEHPDRTVVRPVECDMNAGGKGFNAARVIRRLGGEVVALGTMGGLTGEMLRRCLDNEEVAADLVEVAAPSRVSTCLYERGSQTFREYLEEGSDATEDEAEEMRSRFEELLDGVTAVTLNGSSPGANLDPLFTEFALAARNSGKTVVLDTYGNPVVEASQVPPHWIRCNRDELRRSYGESVQDDPAVLLENPSVDGVVISDGAGKLLCVCREGKYEVVPPVVKEINAVGSGDALTGAFTLGLVSGLEIEEALRWGAAAGSANASRLLVCEFNRSEWEELLGRVEVRRLD